MFELVWPKLIFFLIQDEKTKKWKPYWFVLNHTERQLYYFANEKVCEFSVHFLLQNIVRSLRPAHAFLAATLVCASFLQNF